MDSQFVVLRKLIDDPSSRSKILSKIKPEHFTLTATKYIFKICVQQLFSHESIVTVNTIGDFISRLPISDAAKARSLEAVGVLAATKSPLESEVDYAIDAMVADATTNLYYDQLGKAVDALNRQCLSEASDIIRELPERAQFLSPANERCHSARSMINLETVAADELRLKTGFQVFDGISGGARLGELWLWAAFTGECKSTALINIAHECFLAGQSCLFVSLEMDRIEIQRRLFCCHASRLGMRLKYSDVERGSLTEEAKVEFKKVAEDFDHNSSYGDIRIWRPPLGVTILDVGRELDKQCQEKDCKILIIDYIQKLRPIHERDRIRESLNETLDLSKRLAMESRSACGAWVLSGYQTSTEGRKQAEKNGFYDLWALSETIGAGQVANVVLWSLLTERCRQHKEVKVGMAKSRNSGIRGSTHFLVLNPEYGVMSKAPVRETTDFESNDFFEVNTGI